MNWRSVFVPAADGREKERPGERGGTGFHPGRKEGRKGPSNCRQWTFRTRGGHKQYVQWWVVGGSASTKKEKPPDVVLWVTAAVPAATKHIKLSVGGGFLHGISITDIIYRTEVSLAAAGDEKLLSLG